jgi:hypothetical protein
MQLNINSIDGISPFVASLKTGNDLVTERPRKLLNFAFFNLRQLRTTSTYKAKNQRVHPFSHLITLLQNIFP